MLTPLLCNIGMASMFTGKTTSNPQDVGPKDLMVVLLSDLKSSVSSTKPSNYTISSLLGRLFLSFHIFLTHHLQWVA
jgi:hypothetical protein